MREKFQRFMYGRYGVDELGRFESTILWIPLLLSFFIRIYIVRSIMFVLMLAIMVHMYSRMFSKNRSKRYEENQAYLNARYKLVVKIDKIKNRFKQRKLYKFYKCPMCKQQVRVPKGHGRIEITCPKCREHFVKRS